VSATLDEQNTWEYYRQRRNKDAYYHYRSLCKSKNKRHGEEKDRMIQLRAVSSTTAEYVGSLSESAALDDDVTSSPCNYIVIVHVRCVRFNSNQCMCIVCQCSSARDMVTGAGSIYF